MNRPRAFLLAAGAGARARPITDAHPKVLFPILGVPLLHLHADSFAAAGFEEFGMNLGPHADAIEREARAMRGVRAALFREPALLGTGGGVRNARAWLGREPVLVRNGDTFFPIDLDRLLREHETHRRAGGVATVALSACSPAERFGGFLVDEDGAVVGLAPPERRRGDGPRVSVYGGTCVLEPRALDLLEEGSEAPCLVRDGLLRCVERGEGVRAVAFEEPVLDLGTSRDLLEANFEALRGGPLREAIERARARRPAGSASPPTVEGRTVEPCWIGNAAFVEIGATVGPFASIGAGARVGEGALVRRSLVWDGASVAAGARLEDAVVAGDAARGPGAGPTLRSG